MNPLEKVNDWLWELPASYKSGMRVPGRIYATEKMLEHIVGDNCLEQVANVAFLPGIQKYSLAMPDIHWGYGFPIGGCCATDPNQGGVISPGGVGYDINCGVRLMRTNLKHEEVAPKIRQLVAQFFRDIPCGLGRGSDLRLSYADERKCVYQGAPWAVEHGSARPRTSTSLKNTGSSRMPNRRTSPTGPSNAARASLVRLGSGNHFLEVQIVDEIFYDDAAEVMGLFKGQVTVMIHCGSRGFGYQVCDDYLKVLRNAPAKYGIHLPDRQLVSAPVRLPEGQEYLSSMRLRGELRLCEPAGVDGEDRESVPARVAHLTA